MIAHVAQYAGPDNDVLKLCDFGLGRADAEPRAPNTAGETGVRSRDRSRYLLLGRARCLLLWLTFRGRTRSALSWRLL